MILANDDLQEVRKVLDDRSGMDDALLIRCGDLLHLGKYDQAVHSAFVLLEERLRKFVGRDGLTGVVMVQNLFSKKGTLTRLMALNEKDRAHYLNLFEAAFSLYRNPAAHTVTNYDPAMGKAIVGLVNLLLLIMGDPDQVPLPNVFPDNVENAILLTEEILDLSTAHRLRNFLGRCYQLGIDPRATKSTYWVPFKYDAVQKLDNWDAPRRYPLTMFYIVAGEKKPGFRVPLEQYYSRVVGLDLVPLGTELRHIGFRATGRKGDYLINFAERNDQELFDALLAWMDDVVKQLIALEQS